MPGELDRPRIEVVGELPDYWPRRTLVRLFGLPYVLIEAALLYVYPASLSFTFYGTVLWSASEDGAVLYKTVEGWDDMPTEDVIEDLTIKAEVGRLGRWLVDRGYPD